MDMRYVAMHLALKHRQAESQLRLELMRNMEEQRRLKGAIRSYNRSAQALQRRYRFNLNEMARECSKYPIN